MASPREFTGSMPSGAAYEEGMPQPIHLGGADGSADADRAQAANDEAMMRLQRRKQRQAADQQFQDALLRYQSGAQYHTGVGGSPNGSETDRPLHEVLAPWEQQLLRGIAPDNGNPMVRQTPFAFNEEALMPGDRELVKRRMILEYKKRQRQAQFANQGNPDRIPVAGK